MLYCAKIFEVISIQLCPARETMPDHFTTIKSRKRLISDPRGQSEICRLQFLVASRFFKKYRFQKKKEGVIYKYSCITVQSFKMKILFCITLSYVYSFAKIKYVDCTIYCSVKEQNMFHVA